MKNRPTIQDIRDVFIWLKGHDLELDVGKLHRDFSDGINVAKILKKIYPRMVEMNNYPKCSNTNLKIKNWETLNLKVLSKIGLQLSGKRIVKLAKGEPGTIECLLHQIMLKELQHRREKNTTISLQEKIWTENDDVVTVNIKRLVDGEIIEKPEKLILYSIYDEANKKSQMLSAEIKALAEKIEHLEKLYGLKLEHLNEIRARFAKSSLVPLMPKPVKSDIPPLDLKGITGSLSDSSTIVGGGEF